MEGSSVTNYMQKAMSSLFAGITGALTGPKQYVPAIAPMPVNEVNSAYSGVEPFAATEDKKVSEVIEEQIVEIAKDKRLPYTTDGVEVELAKGGIVKRETIAKVGEKEPEVVQPVRNYGESVEAIYKEGASLLISSSLGFLKSLPPSTAKGGVLAEANRLKTIFGISTTAKPKHTIGLKAPLVWWGGAGMKAKEIKGKEKEEEKEAKKSGGFMGNPLRMLKNMKNVGKKGLKFLKKYGGKAGKSVRKVAASGMKLVKGAKKASKALLKKGSKKLATKLGGKAVAKVGAKALGKGLLKKIPFVGLGAGLLFAGQRLMAGDFKGAALEAMSGAASMIPGAGTAISIGLDATLAAKDMGVLPGQKKAENQVASAPAPDPTKDMYGRPIILNPPTMKAWKKAVNRAAKDGINLPMSVTSSYRSPEQQAALVAAAAAGDERAINPAPVGQSPHGQGWAIDIDGMSKANEWMREKGKKFGFEWQGEKDPVHFDYQNNEKNNKWLQKGKNKWLPDIPPQDSKIQSSGVKTTTSTDETWAKRNEREFELMDQGLDPAAAAKQALAEFPVIQGTGGGAGGGAQPKIIPVPQVKTVYIPMGLSPSQKAKEKKKQIAIIDPHGKASSYNVVGV